MSEDLVFGKRAATKHPLSEEEERLLRQEEEAAGYAFEEIEKEKEYGMCFACGEENPIGLHLHFFKMKDGCIAFFTPKAEHQSYNGRMHGGLITVLLDEIMGNYLFRTERKPAYTARMDLRFRAPVIIGTVVKCRAAVVKRKGRLVVMQAQVFNPDGSVAAEAEAHMMQKG